MSISNSFEDVLKQVLVTEKKKVSRPIPKPVRKQKKPCYVSEALNANSMPNTMTPAGYAGGPRGMPPFSKYTTDAHTGSIDMRDIGKMEDEFAKSSTNKPYPLNTVLDFIATSGEALKNAQSMLEMSMRKNDVTLTTEHKKMIKDAQQSIKSSLGNISRAAKWIDSINLG